MASIAQVVHFYRRAYQLRRGRLEERNLELWDQPTAVQSYRARTGLTDCERYLCEKYIAPGASVLDIGVGAGRTTSEVSALAESYVGIDYSPAMVQAGRDRFPELRFEVMDAADMSTFPDGAFDVLFFSYNGIDYLYPEAKRLAFLAEARRVLSDRGFLIFSTHNARAVVYPGDGKGGRLASMIDVAKGTLRRFALYLPQKAVWRGHGYVLDPRYGGLVVHQATPRRVAVETRSAGFEPVETVAGDHPKALRTWVTRWIYYVCRRSDGVAEPERSR